MAYVLRRTQKAFLSCAESRTPKGCTWKSHPEGELGVGPSSWEQPRLPPRKSALPCHLDSGSALMLKACARASVHPVCAQVCAPCAPLAAAAALLLPLGSRSAGFPSLELMLLRQPRRCSGSSLPKRSCGRWCKCPATCTLILTEAQLPGCRLAWQEMENTDAEKPIMNYLSCGDFGLVPE